MSDDKIILFPQDKIVRQKGPIGPIGEAEAEINEKLKKQQYKDFIEGNVDDISIGLLRTFVDMGIRTQSNQFLADLAMLIDSMRGLIYRDFGMYHPAQRLSDKIVTVKEHDDGQPKTAKLEYSKVIKNMQDSYPLNEALEEEVENSQYEKTVDFEPDFEPDNDDNN